MDYIYGFHMLWQLKNGEIEPVNLWDLRSGKLTLCELENHHFFFMANLTNSVAIFNSKLLNYQRIFHENFENHMAMGQNLGTLGSLKLVTSWMVSPPS